MCTACDIKTILPIYVSWKHLKPQCDCEMLKFAYFLPWWMESWAKLPTFTIQIYCTHVVFNSTATFDIPQYIAGRTIYVEFENNELEYTETVQSVHTPRVSTFDVYRCGVMNRFPS